MILKAMALGFGLWLATMAAFRFGGAWFFTATGAASLWVWAAAAVLGAAVAFVLVKLLRVSPGDEAEAAIGLAAPGMLLDVYAAREFQTVFPNLDPLLGQEFGALMLLFYAAIILTGVFVTRVSAQDERVA